MEFRILLSLVSSLAFGIFTGVFLPTFDQTADIWLIFDTYYFHGNGIEMAGCRACFEKLQSDGNKNSYSLHTGCNVCVSSAEGYGQSGVYCPAFPSSLDTISRLQTSAKCETEDWTGIWGQVLK